MSGYADLHAHLMAHLAFGGRLFWGQPHTSGDPLAEMADELGPCTAAHGSWRKYLNPEGRHRAGGYPRFDGWPRYSTLVHQQAHIDWLKRAYDGGLRLVCCLAVNSEALAQVFGGGPTDDRAVIDLQIQAMWEMVRFLDKQAGGPGAGWLQIALSPGQARAIIAAGKLAVVLGTEVDSLGNWRTPAGLQSAADAAGMPPRELIRSELLRLHRLGVRQITPIHLTDNAFGGAAIYNSMFDALNVRMTGDHYKVTDAWESGVRYRLDADRGSGLIRLAVRLRGYGLRRGADPTHSVRGGHANVKGLTEFGVMLLQEMMQLGMILDIDHHSQRATDEALAILAASGYPVVSSHTGFRDLAFTADIPFDNTSAAWAAYGTSDVHKVASEAHKRADQLDRIRALGGLVAPILNQGDVRTCCPEVANDCAGSVRSWAQAYLYALRRMGRDGGIALGSDVNGLAGLPGPRFGTHAAAPLAHDRVRRALRRAQMDAQTHGVRYAEPLADYRAHRWDGPRSSGYSAREAGIWEGIALARSGAEPEQGEFPPGRSHGATEWVKNVARGFRVTSLDELSRPGLADKLLRFDAARVQRGAFFAKCGRDPASIEDAGTRAVCAAVAAVWERVRACSGSNEPLTRSRAGQRDFDVNVDGMAHYGLLPDLLQDARDVGVSDADLAPLLRSAEAYVQLWERCVAAAPRPHKAARGA